MEQKRTHVIACADAWLKDAGQPTYTELLQKVESMINTTAAQPLDLDKLEALAKAAIPGPWKVDDRHPVFIESETAFWPTYDDAGYKVGRTGQFVANAGESTKTANFIAAANPAVILQLIAQARTARLDTTASASDACAEMRALCSNCGGTGEVHRADGEYIGTCDCMFQTIASPPPPTIEMKSINTPEFQALAGTWCGASQSCDQWTRTVGAKQAWADMIAYIDSRATLAPVAAQQAAAQTNSSSNSSSNCAAKAPAAQAGADYNDPTLACSSCGLTMGESRTLGHIKLGILAASPTAQPAKDEQQDAKDAARFQQAIALEDNAEALHGAVLNHAPDAAAIRDEFDGYLAAQQTLDSANNSADEQKGDA